MGFLAVLTSKNGPAFDVLECHVNVWVVPGLIPGHHTVLWDLGLLIVAPADMPVEAVEVLLPFDTEPADKKRRESRQVVSDLFEPLRDEDVTSLVFGSSVRVRSRDSGDLEVEGERQPLWLTPVVVADAAREEPDRPDRSHWHLPLLRAIPEGESRYIRVRFRVYRPGRTWQWKRSGFGKNGARLDVRIGDMRDGHPNLDLALRDRMRPIEQLNFFVIAPWLFVPELASPELRYTRVLEGGKWREYLGGVVSDSRLQRMLVHYWRHPPHHDAKVNAGHGGAKTGSPTPRVITVDAPYRMYLDVTRANGLLRAGNFVRVLAIVFLAFSLAIFLAARMGGLTDLVDGTLRVLEPLILWVLGASSLTAILSRVRSVRTWTRNSLQKPRMALRQFERWLREAKRSR